METKSYPYPEFIDKLVKLEPHELLGVARLLNVDIYKDDPNPKEPDPESSVPAQLQNKIPRTGEEVGAKLSGPSDVPQRLQFLNTKL